MVLALSFLIVLLSFQAHAISIESKCSACRCVAGELQARIDKELPKNHLDMRHRLDANGQRYGKVIEYKASELRAYELLEGLCEGLSDYTFAYVNNTETGKRSRQWVKERGLGSVPIEDDDKPNREERKVRTRQLEAYCGSVLEDYEEDIVEALKGDEIEDKGVFTTVCERLTKACKQSKKAKPVGHGEL